MSEKRVRAVLITSTVANVLLMGMKLGIGFLTLSRALIADGVNSTLDIFFSVMILVSFRMAARPADKDHPYGHGNIEVLVAFIAALIIIGTGGFIVYDGIKNILSPMQELPSLYWLALAASAVTIAAKLCLYLYARSAAKRYRSPAVEVQAADHRADILATSAALLGILFTFLGVRFLDPVAAVIVAGFIIWTGIKLVKDNLKVLLDAQPSDEFFTPLKNRLAELKDVREVRHMRAHPVGTYYFLEITITVDRKLSVKDGHAIAERVRSKLMKRESRLKDVIVHVEPTSD